MDFRPINMIKMFPLVIFLVLLSRTACQAVPQPLPSNFYNLTGCLYTTVLKGTYKVTFYDGTENEIGNLTDPNYEGSSCILENKPGKLVLNYELNDNNFHSMSLELELNNDPKDYTWGVTKSTLNISPNNKALFPKQTLEMHLADGGSIYAPSEYSYSCSSLVLVNSEQPTIRLTLKRFQFQTFHESATRIFAVSRDCSSWLTLPQIMGFLLLLFMISIVFMGAYLLTELGSHSSDLKFSKQGGMLMNQAQLDATKAD